MPNVARYCAVAVASILVLPFGATTSASASSVSSVEPIPGQVESWTPPEEADDQPLDSDQHIPEDEWQPSLDTPTGLTSEGEDASAMRAPAGTVAGAPGVGELPWFSFLDFSVAPDTDVRVNLANGNLLVKSNDIAVAGPGYALRQDRFYNGLSTRPGGNQGGWHNNNSTADIGLVVQGTGVTFHGPNGLSLKFTQIGSGSTYTSPPGSNMTLTRDDAAASSSRYRIEENRSGDALVFASGGWLTSTRDRNGVGARYTYVSGSNALDKATHSSGRSLNAIYGSNGTDLTEMRDSAGRSVQYTYTNGALATVTSTDGKKTSYTYDTSGRLSTITLPVANYAGPTVISFTYDSSHRVTKVTQETGIETRFAYSSGKTIVTDANGNPSTYTIDTQGRITATKDALNRTRSQTWTANSDVETSTDGFGTNKTTYTYDGSGNRTNAQLPTGAAAAAVYTIGAGCNAPNTGTAFQPKCSTDDAGNKKQYQYDAAGNQTKQSDTTGSTPAVEFERTYNGCGGLAGQVCTTKDGRGAGSVTSYTYDSKGNLTKVTPPSPLGATTYTHDSLGRVLTVTDGNGHTTSFKYDKRDRIIETTHNNGDVVAQSYWDNGLPYATSDGGIRTYEYDDQGRITRVDGPRGRTYFQKFTYDKVGNMLTSSDETQTVTYRYDAANQLTQLVEPGGACPASGPPAANSGCVLFEYDVNGLETKRIFPGGANTVTARDASGRPTRITAAPPTSQGPRFDVSYSYAAPAGDRSLTQTRTAHTEVGVASGAVTTYSYDSRNRLTLAEEKTGATVSASWAYQYDAAGNRTQQVRTGSTGAPAGTINYQYNAANQITSATGQTTTWTYDGAGNQTRNGLTGKTATFDDRGAQTKLGAVGSSYYASGNDQRISTDGGLVFTDGPLGLMRRQDQSRSTYFADTKYTRTPDGKPVSARDHTSGEVHYFIRDRNDSVAGLFSGTGGSFGGWSYSPYGEERAFSPSTYPPLQYNFIRYISGHYEGDNIYKLGARYYDAALGRFTQVDPSGQEQNPYSYSSGDPVNLSDPTGLLPEGAAGLIASAPAALIGFGVAGVVGGALGIGIGIGYAVVAGATASGVEASLSGASDEEVTRQTFLGGITGGLGAFFVR